MRIFAVLLAITGGCGGLHAASETVAVLPFFNHSDRPDLDWVGESIAETLRESLAAAGVLALPREDRVEVYRRLSVRSAAPLTRATVIRIGESLDASQILFGEFEAGAGTAGAELKLRAHILDRSHLRAGPEFGESGQLGDLSLLQSRLAWQCLHYYQPRASGSEEDYLKNRPPVRVDAVENYVRGLLASAPEQQIKLFAQSAKLDERYSEPHFQLGRIAFGKKEYRTAQAWLEKVAGTDTHYHEARFLLGLCAYYQGAYETAEKTLQKVAEEVPLNEVFNNLGAAQCRMNKPQAQESFRKALEGDESDPDYWFNLGYALWKHGQNDQAARDFEAVLDRTPDDAEAKNLLARCRRGSGPEPGEFLGSERLKKSFEETTLLQLQAELKK